MREIFVSDPTPYHSRDPASESNTPPAPAFADHDPPPRKDHRHDAIMRAALEQMRAAGYHGLTIEQTAARAGVCESAVYRRWPTKARLAAEALVTQVETHPIEASGELRVDIRRVVQRAIQVLVRSPLGRVLPEMVTEIAEDPEARTRIMQLFGPARAAHLSVLYAAASKGELPYDVDGTLLLDIISGTVLYRHLLGRDLGSRVIDQITDLIVGLNLPRVDPGHDETR
jgi:AcrR family transcriptional regulator